MGMVSLDNDLRSGLADVANVVSIGMNTSTAPPWQAETSKAAWRGKLIVIELILNIAGFSLSNWVTFGVRAEGTPFRV